LFWWGGEGEGREETIAKYTWSMLSRVKVCVRTSPNFKEGHLPIPTAASLHILLRRKIKELMKVSNLRI
jgi:hypothetical protein